MSFDQAKLLAYALGELEREEARRVEAFLKTDAEAARFVREHQLLAKKLTTDLNKEKIPVGHGLAGLERALGQKPGDKQPRARNKSGWTEASVGLLIVLAVILYWRKPLTGLWQKHAQQTDASLDFYRPTYSSLSGQGEAGPGKSVSALQVKDALAEWKDRPKTEENFGDCSFSLPAPSREEAGLTKTADEQKAWFYLLAQGNAQLRLVMDASDCRLSLEIRANLSAEARAEVDADLQALENEMSALVERKR